MQDFSRAGRYRKAKFITKRLSQWTKRLSVNPVIAIRISSALAKFICYGAAGP